jgi:hypothetical protein
MKHSAMLKFKILVPVVVALVLGGCVKVNNPDVTAVDYRSSVRFANFANTGSSMAVNLDKSATATATVAFQNGSTYADLPAGARFFSFAYGASIDTLHQALTPNTQYTLYSEYEATNGDAGRSYVWVAERRTFASTVPFPSGMQVVRFINLSSDTAATVAGGLTFHYMYGTTDTTTNALAFGDASPYFQATASASQFLIVGALNDTLLSKTGTAIGATAGRYSVVFSGSKKASSWQAKVFSEN